MSANKALAEAIIQRPKSALEKAGYALAGLFAAAIIYVIAFFVLDEANARFSVIAISAVIVLMTQPLAESEPFRTRGWAGWAIDAALVAAFLWSSWWFFQVREELWTSFYITTPMNIAAGLAGVAALIMLTIRAWG